MTNPTCCQPWMAGKRCLTELLMGFGLRTRPVSLSGTSPPYVVHRLDQDCRRVPMAQAKKRDIGLSSFSRASYASGIISDPMSALRS